MELGSGFGSSTADTVEDVTARIERATTRHWMMTCNLFQASEPRVKLPTRFKRQFEPIIVMRLINRIFWTSLLVLDLAVRKRHTTLTFKLHSTDFFRAPIDACPPWQGNRSFEKLPPASARVLLGRAKALSCATSTACAFHLSNAPITSTLCSLNGYGILAVGRIVRRGHHCDQA
jgi:hypothetical protein